MTSSRLPVRWRPAILAVMTTHGYTIPLSQAEYRERLEEAIRDESARLSSASVGIKTVDQAREVMLDAAARLFDLVKVDDRVYLPKLLVEHVGVPSMSEGRRLLTQGAVKVNGQTVTVLDMPRSELDGAEIQIGIRRKLELPRDV